MMANMKIFMFFLLYQIPYAVISASVSKTESFQASSVPTERVEGVKRYEICSHSFHSWMCPNSSRNKVVVKGLKNVSPSSIASKPFIQDSTQIREASLGSAEPLTVLTPKSTPSGHKSGYDMCSHSFHSWLCRKDLDLKSTKSSNILSIPAKQPSPNISYKSKVNKSKKEDPKYDKCSHPFHSWLCTKPTKVTPAPKVIPKSTIIFSDSTTKVEMKPKKLKQYDMCSHAFHSWLCTKPTKVAPVPKVKPKSNIIFSDSTPKVEKKPKKEKQYDMCSHAFHSWLCQKSTTLKSKSKPKGILSPAPAKPKASIILPAEVPKVKMNLKKVKEKSYDKCFHAFHSWLCQPVHQRRITSYKNEPSSLSKPHYSESKPISNKMQPTSAPPLPSSPPPLLPPSIPITETPATFSSKGKYDKCSHSFHSWLCTNSRLPLNHNLKLPSHNLKAFSKVNVNSYEPAKPKPKPKMNYSNNNICNHPFHSWICTNNKNPNLKKLTSVENPKKPSHNYGNKQFENRENIMSYSSNMEKSSSITPTAIQLNQAGLHQNFGSLVKGQTSSTSSITKGKLLASKILKNTNHASICSHPFHSFLCPQHKTRNLIGPSFQSSQGPSTNIDLRSRESSSVIQKAQLHMYSECKHPFNSRNCHIPYQQMAAKIDPKYILKMASKIDPKYIPNISSLPLEGELSS